MRTVFKNPKLKLAVLALAAAAPGALLISHAQTPPATSNSPPSTTNPADAEKELAEKQRLAHERAVADSQKAFRTMGMVSNAWHFKPVDVYMVGSDLKQPTFSGVVMLTAVELPGGVFFFTARDKDNRSIVLNPSQIIMTRSVDPEWK